MLNSKRLIADVETTNVSFVRMVKTVQDLGVDAKHCCFPLDLMDTSLIGIDPHDPNLSSQLQMKILQESAINYFYFLREVVRVPHPGGKVTKFGLNRLNLAQAWAYDNDYNFICNGVAQGKTIGSVARCLWEWTIGKNVHIINVIEQSKEDSLEFINKFKAMRDLLPEYFRAKQSDYVLDRTFEMGNALLRNKICTTPVSNSIRSAEIAGRLITHSSVLFNNFDSTPYSTTILRNILPDINHHIAINMRGREYILNVNKDEIPFIDFSEELFSTNRYIIGKTPRSIPDDFTTSYDPYNLYDDATLTTNTKDIPKFIYIKMNIFDLGCDRKYFDTRCRELNHNPLHIRRELLLMDTTDDSPIREEELQQCMGK